jgi:hypothetical protein
MTTASAHLGGSEFIVLELTFKRAAVIWWALFWRGLLLALGSGFVVGFVEGLLGFNKLAVTMSSGFIVGIPAGIYAVQLALRKRYSHFCIQLVPPN